MEPRPDCDSSVYLYEDKGLNGTLFGDDVCSNVICHTDLVFMPMEASKRSKACIKCAEGVLNQEYYYEYENNDTNHRLLKAAKKGRDYEIFTSFGVEKVKIGVLKPSISGKKFAFYEDREKTMQIDYESQAWGKKGPRMFKVAWTRPSLFSGRVFNRNKKRTLFFCNKKPFFNRSTGAYMLNFSGRVTLPSPRNFQLVNSMEPNYVVLTFGKISASTYVLDHTHPWNAYQVFAIGLASLIY